MRWQKLDCCSYGLHTFLWPQRQYNTHKIAKNLNTLVSSPPPPQPLVVNMESHAATNMAMSKIPSFKDTVGANYLKKDALKNAAKLKRETEPVSFGQNTRIFFGHRKTHCTHKCFLQTMQGTRKKICIKNPTSCGEEPHCVHSSKKMLGQSQQQQKKKLMVHEVFTALVQAFPPCPWHTSAARRAPQDIPSSAASRDGTCERFSFGRCRRQHP